MRFGVFYTGEVAFFALFQIFVLSERVVSVLIEDVRRLHSVIVDILTEIVGRGGVELVVIIEVRFEVLVRHFFPSRFRRADNSRHSV